MIYFFFLFVIIDNFVNFLVMEKSFVKICLLRIFFCCLSKFKIKDSKIMVNVLWKGEVGKGDYFNINKFNFCFLYDR